jgi:hypothetical protein
MYCEKEETFGSVRSGWSEDDHSSSGAAPTLSSTHHPLTWEQIVAIGFCPRLETVMGDNRGGGWQHEVGWKQEDRLVKVVWHINRNIDWQHKYICIRW